jgi:hypothetical protein
VVAVEEMKTEARRHPAYLTRLEVERRRYQRRRFDWLRALLPRVWVTGGRGGRTSVGAEALPGT